MYLASGWLLELMEDKSRRNVRGWSQHQFGATGWNLFSLNWQWRRCGVIRGFFFLPSLRDLAQTPKRGREKLLWFLASSLSGQRCSWETWRELETRYGTFKAPTDSYSSPWPQNSGQDDSPPPSQPINHAVNSVAQSHTAITNFWVSLAFSHLHSPPSPKPPLPKPSSQLPGWPLPSPTVQTNRLSAGLRQVRQLGLNVRSDALEKKRKKVTALPVLRFSTSPLPLPPSIRLERWDKITFELWKYVITVRTRGLFEQGICF